MRQVDALIQEVKSHNGPIKALEEVKNNRKLYNRQPQKWSRPPKRGDRLQEVLFLGL